jgi:imidazoleglycerol phosphate synthase glutamine amidotransferase subunit HisH
VKRDGVGAALFLSSLSSLSSLSISIPIFLSVVGEMAQWLRALAVLPEDLSSVPSTHDGSQPSVTPVLGGNLMPSSGLHGHCMHIVHNYTSRHNTHTHKNQSLKSGNNMAATLKSTKKKSTQFHSSNSQYVVEESKA